MAMTGPSANAFSQDDLAVFARYPTSKAWGQVEERDKELFTSVRNRLKALSERVVREVGSRVALKAETSHPCPNGRSTNLIWCCVYPRSVPNKSYGLQVALILRANGAEICFSMGAGTSQAETEKKIEFDASLHAAQARLADIPDQSIRRVEAGQKRRWYYRSHWLDEPKKSEFQSLEEWARHVSGRNGTGASCSVYFTPAEVEKMGAAIYDVMAEALQTFGPILEHVYTPGNEEAPPGREDATTENVDQDHPADIQLSDLLAAADVALSRTGLSLYPQQVRRYVTSLVTKPFVVLTGNSGTGKTKLAQLFAEWLVGRDGYVIVPVGADWTDSRHVVGYVNHLRKDDKGRPHYQPTPILDLVLRANRTARRPFFLILDEMNLSHVERYFADFLSAMESGAGIPLHSEGCELNLAGGGAVGPILPFPRNLFVVGTVNVDETTYMFSPKVLDRANVIEFRLSEDAADVFTSGPAQHPASDVEHAASGLPETFLKSSLAFRGLLEPSRTPPLAAPDAEALHRCTSTIRDVYRLLHKVRQEFAYRTMQEVIRYVHVDYAVTEDGQAWDWRMCMDCQLLQKVLPKLHGSRRRVEPILVELAGYCELGPEGHEAGRKPQTQLDQQPVGRAADLVVFPRSYEKLCDMIDAVRRDQFVSFIH